MLLRVLECQRILSRSNPSEIPRSVLQRKSTQRKKFRSPCRVRVGPCNHGKQATLLSDRGEAMDIAKIRQAALWLKIRAVSIRKNLWVKDTSITSTEKSGTSSINYAPGLWDKPRTEDDEIDYCCNGLNFGAHERPSARMFGDKECIRQPMVHICVLGRKDYQVLRSRHCPIHTPRRDREML